MKLFILADFFTYLQDKPDLLKLLNDIVSNNYIETASKDSLITYFKVMRNYSMSRQIERLEEKMRQEQDPDRQALVVEQIRKLKLGE